MSTLEIFEKIATHSPLYDVYTELVVIYISAYYNYHDCIAVAIIFPTIFLIVSLVSNNTNLHMYLATATYIFQ